MHQPPLPHFLIIGAMKSGTTTLYRDLLTHPGVFMPAEKEPNNLASDDVLSESGTAAYRELFADARPEQMCGEASTAYTKIPWITGVPQRAKQLLGSDVKLIYIVREPVSRALSQYHHQFTAGIVPEDVDFAFRRHPHLIEFSRYAMQLEPWLETFGHEAVKVICFEQYVADREAAASDVLAFLGLDPSQHQVCADRVYHATKTRPVMTRPWKRLTHHWLYRQHIRPRLSKSVKNYLKRRLLPRIESVAPQPSMQTIDRILERVRPDQERLVEMLALERPWWDLDAVRASYAQRLEQAEPASNARSVPNGMSGIQST